MEEIFQRLLLGRIEAFGSSDGQLLGEGSTLHKQI
jgi:hypothetical protein